MARKILLADDSVTAQNMGRKILADAGYEVITVNNGSAALKKITEAKPDLIVLDVYMPGYSGLEVCQRIKEVGETSRIPILLTVGKLEPFKPEEAKRVRAEGFIVKPFEASELLSALTRLEDKMVPRSESSKPGRFARAIAAVEEGRYDKSVAAEEDTSWKNRIAFPSKKKSKVVESGAGDDPAIYNPVNKDLRTVVDHKTTEPPPQFVKPDGNHVDLAALAPEGLPKDVTPEEIAALAAAAAQMQGKISEARGTEIRTPEPEPPTVVAQSVMHESGRIKEIAETKELEQPAVEPTQAVFAPTAATSAFIEPKAEPKESESPADRAFEIAPISTDAGTAIDSLETAAFPISATANSGNGRVARDSARRQDSEPVTMAVAAGAEHVTVTSRWTAVSVALTPDEAAIALEDEMRKAYAAYVGAESAPADAIEQVPEMRVTPYEPAPVAELPLPGSEPYVAAPVPAEPKTAPYEDAPFISAPEPILAAERDFETVSPPSLQAHVVPVEPGPVHATEFAAPGAEIIPVVEASAEETPVAQATQAEGSTARKLVPPTLPEQPLYQEPSRGVAGPKIEEPEPAAAETAPAEQAMAALDAADAMGEVSTEFFEGASQGIRDAAKRESEIAANTAAAWASWRRIRESADFAEEPATPEDEAAMVAGGAENATEDGPEIASIVDSVLADLRPKIVEEISKKLKKKK